MTPEEIASLRPLMAIADRDGLDMLMYPRALIKAARIGLRVVDPSADDVERVAAQICFDTGLKPWPNSIACARAALKAMTEDGDRQHKEIPV